LKERYSNSLKIEKLIQAENYSEVAKVFFDEQTMDWEQSKIAYRSLGSIQTKIFLFEEFKVTIQHNPERIKSTVAKVEDMFLPSDNCFLCEKNLPEKQKGIILPGEFTLLCNPFPIFPEHFTIPIAKHQPQQIKSSFANLLTFSKMFGKRYSLIYNGPKCGASAPFHLHFQMGTKNYMPIENDIQQMKNEFGNIAVEREEITLSFINDGCRKIIFIESINAETIIDAFTIIYDELRGSGDEEPKMNIISSFNEEFGWSLVIFLREKHRPDVFYKKDESRITVSPATIDIGGIVILPEKKDFDLINRDAIMNIFKEVSISEEKFSMISENLSKKMQNKF
jgi:ATP adenylyltransferase/5',5'''-P-1,P-4-tetraphosphate phosphorylase II